MLDTVAWDATNAARERIMKEIHLRTTQVISLIRTPERHLARQIANGYIPERAFTVASPLSQSHKNWITSIMSLYTFHQHAVYLRPIYTLDGDS